MHIHVTKSFENRLVHFLPLSPSNIHYISVSPCCSELAGLLLIDPAVESLFEGGHNSSPERNRDREDLGTEQAPPMNWSSYWYRGVVPHMQGMRLSATVGFNRVTLMLRLMSPVEEPELKQVLPDEVITMKVSRKQEKNGVFFLFFTKFMEMQGAMHK